MDGINELVGQIQIVVYWLVSIFWCFASLVTQSQFWCSGSVTPVIFDSQPLALTWFSVFVGVELCSHQWVKYIFFLSGCKGW